MEHVAGQIVNSVRDLLIAANVADGRVYRRRIYAFELMAGLTHIFNGSLPAVDVFSENETPVEDMPRNQVYEDMIMELVCDLYLTDPSGSPEPNLDERTQELRLAIERVVMGGDRKQGLDYVIDTRRVSATPQTLEREADWPVYIYRLTFEVEYRMSIADPVEV